MADVALAGPWPPTGVAGPGGWQPKWQPTESTPIETLPCSFARMCSPAAMCTPGALTRISNAERGRLAVTSEDSDESSRQMLGRAWPTSPWPAPGGQQGTPALGGGSLSGSLGTRHPSTPADVHGMDVQVTGSDRRRSTQIDRWRDLRIRRLGVRVPPSALAGEVQVRGGFRPGDSRGGRPSGSQANQKVGASRSGLDTRSGSCRCRRPGTSMLGGGVIHIGEPLRCPMSDHFLWWRFA